MSANGSREQCMKVKVYRGISLHKNRKETAKEYEEKRSRMEI